MWAAWLWVACAPPIPDERLVDGVDVVAVGVDPLVVSVFDTVDVDAWVIDRWGLGADVLIWPCTAVPLPPERLRCAEGLDVNGDEVRVSAWSHAGVVGDQQFSVTLQPPLQVWLAAQELDPELLAEDGVPVPVFVLACEAGVCPIFEAWRADPEPGSEAYARLGRWLADPELLAGQAERDQLSLALKVFWLTSEPAELRAPNIIGVGRRAFPDQQILRFQWRVEDRSVDATELPTWSTRVRYTSGHVVSERFEDGVLTIDWTPTGSNREGEMVVSIQDGRSGVAAVSVDLPASLQ